MRKSFVLNKTLIITVIVIIFTLCLSLTWAQEGDGESPPDEEGSKSAGGTITTSPEDTGRSVNEKLFDADQSGSFNYTFPIDLPSGTNGMGPSLAISYNSAAENGILGVGFSLQGLSEITRDPSYPIDFNSNDHYLLDGQKLIWVPEGTAGVVNAGYYHTENESYLRIACYDVNNNKISNPQKSIISYWVVTQKNGSKMYYGFTSTDHGSSNDGKINAIGKNSPRVWALSKVEDVNGNYYIIEYFEDNDTGAFYPKRIVYTKGNGLNKFKEVNFYYEKRTDYCAKYMPTKIDETLRLCWLTVSISGNLLREYKIEYECPPYWRSRINAIYQYGSGGNLPLYKSNGIEIADNYVSSKKSLPSITFKWQNSLKWEANKTSAPVGYNPSQLLNGDFNGDGMDDLYMMADNGWLSVQVSNGKEFSCQVGAGQLPDYQRIIGDFDGDGRMDFAGYNSVGTIVIFRSTGDNFIKSNSFSTGNAKSSYSYIERRTDDGQFQGYSYYNDIITNFLSGDWNGDGKDDLIFIKLRMEYGNRIDNTFREAKTSQFLYVYGFDDNNSLVKLNEEMFIEAQYLPIQKVFPNDNIDLKLENKIINFVVSDFTGDGKADLFGYRSDDGCFCLLQGGVFSNSGLSNDYQHTYIDDRLKGYNKFFIGDFKGNGINNLCLMNDSGVIAILQHYFVTINKFKGLRVGGELINIGPGYGCTTGDFNGDGKTDVGCYKGDGNFYMVLSTGASFTKSYSGPAGPAFPAGYNPNKIFAGDYNGDDMDDLYLVADNGYYCIQLSNGRQFVTAADAVNITNLQSNAYGCVVGDFNGDGLSDYGCYKSDGSFCLIKSKYAGHPDLLSSVINKATGQKIDISYKSASQFPCAIITGINEYPIKSNKNSRQLVESITYSSTYSDKIDPITIKYDYYNGKVYTKSRSLQRSLGFEKITKTNPDGSYTITYFEQDDRDKAGMVNKVENYGSDGCLYTRQVYGNGKKTIYANTGNYNSIITTYKFMEINYNCNGLPIDKAIIYRQNYYYDDYGNCNKSVYHGEVSVGGYSTKFYDQVQILTDYALNEISYINVPIQVSKYAYKLNFQTNDYDYETGLSLASFTRYYYDYNTTCGTIGSKGLLTKVETQVNDTDWISTSNKYDSYGNLIETIDPKGNTNTVTYDKDYNAYVIGQGNAKGHTTSIEYNEYMRPVCTTDVNSQKWSTSYDEYGRIIKEWSPIDDENNPTKGTEYIDAVVDDNDNITSYMSVRSYQKENKEADYTAKKGYLESFTYYDGLGRIIQSKTEAVENDLPKWRTIDYYYDTMGRNRKVSVPYFTDNNNYSNPDETVKNTHLEYDPIGRVVRAHNTDGTSKSMIYKQKWTVCIDELNHAAATEVDGNLTKSYTFTGKYTDTNTGLWDTIPEYYSMIETKTAWNGTIITSYDNDNNPIYIKTETDMVGRKFRYIDPDMGIWQYTYDANGNLLSQTDSKNQTINFEYDELNRVALKKYGNTIKTRYYYDEQGYSKPRNGIGRLTSVIYDKVDNSYVYSEKYYYDEKGRLNVWEEFIGGNGNKYVNYTYDAMDRVVVERYPDGEYVNYTYSKDGNLEKISNSSGYTYVKDISYQANGKVKRISFGNNVTMNYGYDPDSFRLTSIRSDNLSLFDIAYSYTAVGNVETRTDHNYPYKTNDGYTEKYTYDAFNRLIQAESNVNLYGTKTYTCDRINNITQKDGRTYSYDSTRPRAVREDGKYRYEYDENGNITEQKVIPLIGFIPLHTRIVSCRKFSYDYENRVESVLKITECFKPIDIPAGIPITPKMLTLTKRYESSEDLSTYTYDDSGRRIKKIEKGITTYYYFNNYEVVTDGVTTKEIKYYFANGQKIAQRTKTNTDTGSGTLIYMLSDHLGSSTVLTDENGNVIQRTGYMPFGEFSYMIDGAGNNLAESNTKYMFTGQEKENDDLYYYGARYYDPALGRFLQADTVLDGLNRYAYCGNNPVNYVDPTGHTVVDFYYRMASASSREEQNYLSEMHGCHTWTDNGDGSYTAHDTPTGYATLWGLEQITGINYHNSNFNRQPETLRDGETVSFTRKKVFPKKEENKNSSLISNMEKKPGKIYTYIVNPRIAICVGLGYEYGVIVQDDHMYLVLGGQIGTGVELGFSAGEAIDIATIAANSALPSIDGVVTQSVEFLGAIDGSEGTVATGWSSTYQGHAGALLGVSFDMNTKQFGLDCGNIGGGVYWGQRLIIKIR